MQISVQCRSKIARHRHKVFCILAYGDVTVSTGIMQLVKLSDGESLNSKIKNKR